mgnify:CR=1 FL=1
MAPIKKIFNALDAMKMSTRLLTLAGVNLIVLAWMTFAAHDTAQEILASFIVIGFFIVIGQSIFRSFKKSRLKEIVLDTLTNNVMITNKDDVLHYMNTQSYKSLAELQENIQNDVPSFKASSAIGMSIHKIFNLNKQMSGIINNLRPRETHSANIEIGERTLELNIVGIFEDDKRLGSYAEWSDITEEARTKELKDMMDSAFDTLNTNVIIVNNDDELTWMNEASYNDMRALEGKIQKVLPDFNVDQALGDSIHNMHKDPERAKRILRNMKPGDTHTENISLGGKTIEVKARPLFVGDKRIGAFAQWQDRTRELKNERKQEELEKNIKQTALSVNEAASEIAEGNINLSERTEAQAANIEQTTASMQLITEKVEENAKTSEEALSLVNDASDIADKGGMVVASAMEAMEEINKSSTEISNIISVVDEIAFQTNLLALNAAVEAARAGEQGRGFAVVASEVRTLAGRSATAAKEIKELISKSVEKVQGGTEQVNSTGDNLNRIIENVKNVAERVEMISSASREQSEGVAEINKAIQQMDAFTQQNAALVEEAASASKSLEEQAEIMIRLVTADDAETALDETVNQIANDGPPQKSGKPKENEAAE